MGGWPQPGGHAADDRRAGRRAPARRSPPGTPARGSSSSPTSWPASRRASTPSSRRAPDSPQNARVSRLLFVASDGSTRFYRDCDALVSRYPQRLLACRLEIAGEALGEALLGSARMVRSVLVSDKKVGARRSWPCSRRGEPAGGLRTRPAQRRVKAACTLAQRSGAAGRSDRAVAAESRRQGGRPPPARRLHWRRPCSPSPSAGSAGSPIASCSGRSPATWRPTPRERDAIARLRYEVHIREQNVPLGEADHERRRIWYPDDDLPNTLHFYAGSPEEMLGCLRIRLWAPGQVAGGRARVLLDGHAPRRGRADGLRRQQDGGDPQAARHHGDGGPLRPTPSTRPSPPTATRRCSPAARRASCGATGPSASAPSAGASATRAGGSSSP